MIETCVLTLGFELILDRPPDPAGADYWQQQPLSTVEYVQTLAHSTEGRAQLWASRPKALEPLADAINIACDTQPANSINQIIDNAAAEYGVSAVLMHAIIECESNHNPNAKNPRSSASGLGQHLARYWPARAEAIGMPGASVFDPVANARATAWMLSTQGTRPWDESRGCWS